MDTTAAATQAGVTVATIRTWCRAGVVQAAKVAGRWVIEADSLIHRITNGRSHITTPTYHVTDSTTRHGTPTYSVTRTDGTAAGHGRDQDFRIDSAVYLNREHAEIHCAFVNATPDAYRIKREARPARSLRGGYYWQITGGRDGDPSPLRHAWDEGNQVKGDWPEGTTMVDVLISLANRHAESADTRIAKHAEKQVIDAAEAAVHEAREADLAKARAEKGELATPRQVDYIVQLLAARERSGEGGGFFSGPTDRAGIEMLSKGEASMYITSLKGDY